MIEYFGKTKEDWFTKKASSGKWHSSHDTFDVFFAAIDAEQFSACFSHWVAGLSDLTDGEVNAIDGKTVR